MEQVKLEVVLGEGAETGGNTENFVFAVMPKIDETVPQPALRSPTNLKSTCWLCGTNLSTLERRTYRTYLLGSLK